jgi:hypothetical protein
MSKAVARREMEKVASSRGTTNLIYLESIEIE